MSFLIIIDLIHLMHVLNDLAESVTDVRGKPYFGHTPG